MKKFIYTLVIGTIIWSCGGSGGDTPIPPPPPENKAPTVPTLVYPTNNLLCIDNVLNFNWNASTDPDGDAITYQVQVAKDSQFSQIVHTITESTTTKNLSLDEGIAYYWRVKATDNKNASSDYSSVNQFYTEGVGVSNHLPFAPVLVAPELNSIVSLSTVNLQWTASDVDTDDTLTFDVYFGSNNPPALKIANLNVTNLDVNLTASTNYYWKIVVKDGQGGQTIGQTIGQIWNFNTD